MLLVSLACAGARRAPAQAPVAFDASPSGFERWVAALSALLPKPAAAPPGTVWSMRLDAGS